MIKALIVDDERHARESLAMKLRTYCEDVRVLALADSVDTASQAIETHKPELLFLDIEMPGHGGFDLLDSRPVLDFSVIFVTAFERHAIQAIKHSALDYLLKPVGASDLQAAVAKARQVRRAINTASGPLTSVKDSVGRAHDHRLVLPTEEGFEFLASASVLRCRAESNYTRLYLVDGTSILASKTLGEFESMLAPHGFFRVHHSHLVNCAHVKRYIKGRGGSIELIDGSTVEVSIRRRDAFLGMITS